MADTLPRWGLPAIDFITTDVDTIKTEIITGYEQAAGRTLATGDPVRLFLLSIADRFIQLRSAFNIGAQQNLLSYATGEYLDALGANMQVPRLQESPAVTTLRFTLSQTLGEAYIIPAGFEVTNGTVTFATDEELIIAPGDLSDDVKAHCTTAGVVGNGYVAGQISTIVTPQTFLASAQNITETSGGADIENDEDYAYRIKLSPNSYSVAGPEKAYIYHAKSAEPAIIDVAVDSPNPGEVKVYPLLENGELPNTDICSEIYDYLSSDDIRPLTDEVEVLPPEVAEYEINVNYWISSDDVDKATAIAAAVDAAVEEYRLWQQTKIGRDITPDELIARVKNAGASRVDFSTLSPAAWTALGKNQVAQCTSVTVEFKGHMAA